MSETASYKKLKRLYGPHYQKLTLVDDHCLYCGDTPVDYDYVPSLKYCKNKSSLPPHLTKVHICKTCRLLLSDGGHSDLLLTLGDRCRFLCNAYFRAYRRIKCEWTDEELQEMGPEMQRRICDGLTKKALYLQKSDRCWETLIELHRFSQRNFDRKVPKQVIIITPGKTP